MIERREDEWIVAASQPAARLEDRCPAFLPELTLPETGPSRALVAIGERMVGLLEERLQRAPAKAKLAFLDLLGVEPIAAQPARCPVVLELLPGVASGRAPKGTTLQSQPVGADPGLNFETTSAIALAASRLAEVKAVLPQNQYVDHTLDVLGEKPFVLFAGGQPIPREVYLAHDRFFAVSAGAEVQLQWELAPLATPPSSQTSQYRWEYWDGTGWMAFAAWRPAYSASSPETSVNPDEYSIDGTEGFRRSGTITLRAGGKPAQSTSIRGVKSYWIRARVLPEERHQNTPTTAVVNVAPTVDRLQLSGVSNVVGFRIMDIRETPRAGAASTITVNLVDESNAPLDATQYHLELLPTAAPLVSSPHQFSRGDTPAINVRVVWFVLPVLPATVVTGGVSVTLGTPDRVFGPLTLDVPNPDRDYVFTLARAGRLPELMFGNGVVLESGAPFQPFGQQPQLGATFLFSCAEVLAKPGAVVTVFTEVTNDFLIARNAADPANRHQPVARWEYWNGMVWVPVPDLKVNGQPNLNTNEANDFLSFVRAGEISFTVPSNLVLKNQFGQEKMWIRATLVSGDYLVPLSGTSESTGPAPANEKRTVKYDKTFPPVVTKFRVEYTYLSPPEPAAVCLGHSNFEWQDHTTAAAFGGTPFTLFRAADEVRPTLYLGFTRSLPADLISLFVNVSRPQHETGLLWEYHDGRTWRPLILERDETEGFAQPGLIQFTWPGTPLLPEPEPIAQAEGTTITTLDQRHAARFRAGDRIAVYQDDFAEARTVAAVAQAQITVTTPLDNKYSAATAGVAPLARFGAPRHWVRLTWPSPTAPKPGDAEAIRVHGLYLNAVWAEQTKTVTNELLGGATGLAGETFDLVNRPVLPGERVEVLELEGRLAEAGWPALENELRAAGRRPGDWHVERDSKTQQVTQVWVRWEGKPHFAGSGPDDRHYVLERSRGQLQFGDGRHGRLPPVLPNNLRVTYRSGGGQKGNVPARAVNMVLGLTAQAVFNPVPAGGGADGELLLGNRSSEVIARRGPQMVRHRGRAITAEDYEQLARAASPGVAVAKVLTPAGTQCVVAAGSVRLVVVPHANISDPQPQPSPQLLADVTQYLQRRSPCNVAGRIRVEGPQYYPVGVEVVLTPRTAEEAGDLQRHAQLIIARFLHAVVGGRDGLGWGFGHALYRSDLTQLLTKELRPALAYVHELRFLDGGAPVAEELRLPVGMLPSVGPLRILLTGTPEDCP